MSADPPDRLQDVVARKAERLARARKRPDNTWRYAAQVGVLAWVFVTPVLLAGWLSKLILRDPSQRWLAVPMISVGAALGGLLVRNKVRQLLREGSEEEEREEDSERADRG